MNKGLRFKPMFAIFAIIFLVSSAVYARGIGIVNERHNNMPALQKSFQKTNLSNTKIIMESNEEEETSSGETVESSSSAKTAKLDFNSDGEVNFEDAELLLNAIDSPDTEAAMMDLNGNGRVDFADFVIFYTLSNFSELSAEEKEQLLKLLGSEFVELIQSMLDEAEDKAKSESSEKEKAGKGSSQNLEVKENSKTNEVESEGPQTDDNQQETVEAEAAQILPPGIENLDETPGKGLHKGWETGKRKGLIMEKTKEAREKDALSDINQDPGDENELVAESDIPEEQLDSQEAQEVNKQPSLASQTQTRTKAKISAGSQASELPQEEISSPDAIEAEPAAETLEQPAEALDNEVQTIEPATETVENEIPAVEENVEPVNPEAPVADTAVETEAETPAEAETVDAAEVTEPANVPELTDEAAEQSIVPLGIDPENIPGKGSHKGWEQGKHKGWDKTPKTVDPAQGQAEQAMPEETAPDLPENEATSLEKTSDKKISENLVAAFDFDKNNSFDFEDIKNIFKAVGNIDAKNPEMDLNGNDRLDFSDVVLAYKVLQFNTLSNDDQDRVLKALSPKFREIVKTAYLR